MSRKRGLFRDVIDPKSDSSAKRLVTLIIAAHFIVASFVILFFSFYVIVVAPKGDVKPSILQLLQNVMEYDFYIMLAGLGFISAENLGQILLQKAKTQAAATILTPTPKVGPVQNVENVEVKQEAREVGDDILEDNDMKEIKKNLTKALKTEE